MAGAGRKKQGSAGRVLHEGQHCRSEGGEERQLVTSCQMSKE